MPRPHRRCPLTLQLATLEDRTAPAAADLDPTFRSFTVFSSVDPQPRSPAVLAVRPDGKVVLALSIGSLEASDFTLIRLNADGTPDASFGTNGQTVFGFDTGRGRRDQVAAVALLPDGRIVVAGSAQTGADPLATRAAIALVTPDGQLDPTFDGDGRVLLGFAEAIGVTVQPDGRIVVAGTAVAGLGDRDFAVARLNPDGTPDVAFGGDGLFVTNEAHLDELATGVVVQADGKIAVAGSAALRPNFGPGSFDFSVVRLNPDGTRDSTFADGRVTIPFDSAGRFGDFANAVALDAQGRIVLAGQVEAGEFGDYNFGVARLTADGRLDPAFGTAGRAVIAFDLGSANEDKAQAVAVEPTSGAVVVTGSVETNVLEGSDDAFIIGVARLTSAGAPDPMFDEDGRAIYRRRDEGPGTVDHEATRGRAVGGATALALTPGGRVLVGTAYQTTNQGGERFAVVRRLVGTPYPAPVPEPPPPPLPPPPPTISPPRRLAVAGLPDDAARLYDPGPDGIYVPAGTAASFSAGGVVRPAVADVDGDGTPDTILGAGPGGGSRVRVVFGDAGVPAVEFVAFESTFTGGVFVAAADLDGDGKAEVVVTPDRGGSGRVSIFSVPGTTVTRRDNFFGIVDATFRGGARPAVGDVNGDGHPDLIVAAGAGGGPRVAVFDGTMLLANRVEPARLVDDFFAYPGADAGRLRDGAYVAAADLTGDGKADLIFGGGPGGGPRVQVLDGTLVSAGMASDALARPGANFFVGGDELSRGGVRVAVKDADGDGRPDLVTGSGEGQATRVRVYAAVQFPQSNGVEPALGQEFDPFGMVLATGVFVG